MSAVVWLASHENGRLQRRIAVGEGKRSRQTFLLPRPEWFRAEVNAAGLDLGALSVLERERHRIAQITNVCLVATDGCHHHGDGLAVWNRVARLQQAYYEWPSDAFTFEF